MKKVLLALLAVIILAGTAYAHSGRTNSDGCHMDRRTGTYHCH